MSQARVTVTVEDQTFEVGPEESFSFGRSPGSSICLDPDDQAISRRAGSLDFEGSTWWVVNRSTVRPLSIVDDLGFRSVLGPGRRAAVLGRTRVIVDGTSRSHTICIEVEGIEPEVRDSGRDAPPPGAPTATGEQVLISPADRLALVALFAGYLEEGKKYDPYPKSYAAAAARLGWPRTTLVKRIEYLRTRLDQAGVPNMSGWMALTNLAEYVISRGIITKADLDLIRRPNG